MSEARRRALQQVDALERDLLLQSSKDLLPQHELRLIGFCLRHLQAPWRPLIAIPDAEISVQLDRTLTCGDLHRRFALEARTGCLITTNRYGSGGLRGTAHQQRQAERHREENLKRLPNHAAIRALQGSPPGNERVQHRLARAAPGEEARPRGSMACRDDPGHAGRRDDGC